MTIRARLQSYHAALSALVHQDEFMEIAAFGRKEFAETDLANAAWEITEAHRLRVAGKSSLAECDETVSRVL